eukprot:TRINITY_DN324_c0_g1_i4.p2 TRINITY_DN324_c0_g1~~TRINITY_DN324_c0_g1_i4.p2  ORF type:complete len:175 (-),score=45.30 TRINITY_DN324_c0_g1_i4:159-683(-)
METFDRSELSASLAFLSRSSLVGFIARRMFGVWLFVFKTLPPVLCVVVSTQSTGGSVLKTKSQTPNILRAMNPTSELRERKAKEADNSDLSKVSIGGLIRNKENQQPIKQLIYATVALFTLPLLVYFSLYFYHIETYFGEGTENKHHRMVYAAISAVVAVHVVLGFFVYHAMKE